MDSSPAQDLLDGIRNFIQGNDLHAILVALAILAITIVVARISVFTLRKLLKSDVSPLPSSSILINIARVGIYLVGISIILAGCFNVNVNGIIAALGVGGIALSLGLQDTIQNFFGGLSVTLMKIVKPGDHIKVNATEGIVEDVNWRHTVVRDFEGSRHVIPNSNLNSNEVTKMNPPGLCITAFSFSYDGQDLDAQLAAMEAAVKEQVTAEVPLRNDPWIFVTTLGAATVTASLHFVVRDREKIRQANDLAMRAIAHLTAGSLAGPGQHTARAKEEPAKRGSYEGEGDQEARG